MGTLASIGLGSNLGDRRAILDAAVADLGGTPGVRLLAVSSYLETPPVGGPSGQGPFLNAAAAIETDLSPTEIHGALRTIEARAGRVRKVRWGERTLDLDLLLFGSRVLDTPELTIPHPRMALRRFVLAPLAEVTPEAVDPLTGRTIADLLANLDRRPSCVALPHARESPAGAALFERIARELNAVDFTTPGPISADGWIVSDKNPGGPDSGPQPTFVVLFDATPAGPYPALRLGPIEPDAWVAEVLAACASTRAGVGTLGDDRRRAGPSL